MAEPTASWRKSECRLPDGKWGPTWLFSSAVQVHNSGTADPGGSPDVKGCDLASGGPPAPHPTLCTTCKGTMTLGRNWANGLLAQASSGWQKAPAKIACFQQLGA